MLDLSKPVQTRNGRPARIICTDRSTTKSPFSVVALVGGSAQAQEDTVTYTPQGRYNSNPAHPDATHYMDLVNVPEKRKGWINLYPYQSSAITPGRFLAFTSNAYASKELADAGARHTDCILPRIACVEVEWDEPA